MYGLVRLLWGINIAVETKKYKFPVLGYQKKRKKKCYLIFSPYSQWNEILFGKAFIFWLDLGSFAYELTTNKAQATTV